MLISKAQIDRLIPHAGRMCLLDGVVEWDAEHIVCTSNSHRDLDNPMRNGDMLGAVCGIEYASQAMATHGALTARVNDKPRAGYLAGLRDVHVSRARMDDFTDPLTIEAHRIAGDRGGVMYSFSVCCGGVQVIEGRATVILDALPPS